VVYLSVQRWYTGRKVKEFEEIFGSVVSLKETLDFSPFFVCGFHVL